MNKSAIFLAAIFLVVCCVEANGLYGSEHYPTARHGGAPGGGVSAAASAAGGAAAAAASAAGAPGHGLHAAHPGHAGQPGYRKSKNLVKRLYQHNAERKYRRAERGQYIGYKHY